MPEVSGFYGIVVYMFFNEHNPPHFHVKYRDFENGADFSPGFLYSLAEKQDLPVRKK